MAEATGETRAVACRMGLIGAHASSAMSPALWRPVLDEVRPCWSYEAWDVHPGGLASLRGRLVAADVVAFNVTMPHKRWAASVADAVSETVRRSGAANLLVREGRSLHAHNTDIDAMRGAVSAMSASRAVVLGAGGAGRAALVSLAGHADEIEVSDPDQAAVAESVEFAARQGIAVSAFDWDSRGERVSSAAIAVNATPVGMCEGDAAVWGTDRLGGLALAYDFVYAGHVTANAAQAEASGVTVVDGWRHLLRQAREMVPLLGLPERTSTLLDARVGELRAGAS